GAGSGLGSCPLLESLHLAGNPLADESDVFAALVPLPSLVELSLDDAHFGTCPVVGRTSDGIGGYGGNISERARVHRDEVDAVRDAFTRERRRAEARRRRAGGRSAALRDAMGAALSELERAVGEGRAAVAAAAAAREVAHRESLAALESDVAAERAALAAAVAAAVAAEGARRSEEERLLGLLERRAALQRRHFLLTSSLQHVAAAGGGGTVGSGCAGGGSGRSGNTKSGTGSSAIGKAGMTGGVGNGDAGGYYGNSCWDGGGGVACHELAEHLPELHHLRDLVRLRQRWATSAVTTVSGSNSRQPPPLSALPIAAPAPLQVLRACRLYSARLAESAAPFWTTGSDTAAADVTSSGKHVAGGGSRAASASSAGRRPPS
ncbi:unnamed protein product, partial [Phaeothamnion confervicola]